MTFPIREPSKCPKCFERTFNVKESRTPGNIKTYIRSCNQCTHYYNYSCRLEIPELDAEECSYYSLT